MIVLDRWVTFDEFQFLRIIQDGISDLIANKEIFLGNLYGVEIQGGYIAK